MKFWVVGLIAASVAGCGYIKEDPTPEQLARGCQIIKCVCEPVRDSILPSFSKRQQIEPLWRPDGSAYCAEGQRLGRKEERSLYDRPLY